MNKLRGSVAVMSLSLILNLGAETTLVNVSKVNPNIRYAKTRTYSSMGWYLCPEAAQCLSEAQEEMKSRGYCLVLYDAYIPHSIQKSAVECDDCIPDKEECLRHSCGIAVDVWMEMEDGTEVAMPTEYDVFTPEARPDYMNLPAEVMECREMLRDVMERHGFKGSPNTWWHFECTECDSCYIDTPLEELE